MYKLIVLLVAMSVAVVAAFDIIEDDEGQQFYLVPVRYREKRQTSIAITKGNPGTRVTLDHKDTIFDNAVHRLDAAASASKNFHPSGPITVGGDLGYFHIPCSNLNLGVQHTKGFGTDFSASGTANLWQKGNSRLDAVGRYDRHYGGSWGTGRPNYYAGFNFNHSCFADASYMPTQKEACLHPNKIELINFLSNCNRFLVSLFNLTM